MPNTTASAVSFTITAQDHASAVLARVNTNLRSSANEAARAGVLFGGQGREGVRKFENALMNLSLSSVGVTGSFQKLTEGMSLLAAGSAYAVPIIAGIGAVAFAINAIGKEAREARQHTQALITELVRAGQVRSGLAASTDYDTVNRQVASIQEQLRRGTKSFQAYDSRTGQQATVTTPLTSDERRALEKQLQAALAARLEASNRILDRGIVKDMPQAREVQTKLQKELANLYMLLDDQGRPIVNLRRSVGGPLDLPFGGLAAPGAGISAGPLTPMFNAIQTQVGEIVDAFETQWGPMIGDAIAYAFGRAFSGEGIGGLLKGFGGFILKQFGDLFIKIGTAMVGFGKIMTAISSALKNVLTSGPASVAAGVALIALGAGLNAIAGSALGGGGRGGGSGNRGGYYAPSGYSGGTGILSSANRPTQVTINVKGGPVIDLRDPETRDNLAQALNEIGPNGTRQVTFNVGRG